jgi:hypothetical protein
MNTYNASWRESPPQPNLRWLMASLHCTTVLYEFLSRILDFGLELLLCKFTGC